MGFCRSRGASLVATTEERHLEGTTIVNNLLGYVYTILRTQAIKSMN